MKPFIVASVCFIIAAVMCAQLSTNAPDDGIDPIRHVEFNAAQDLQPPACGVIGAAAFVLIIAARRVSAHIHPL